VPRVFNGYIGVNGKGMRRGEWYTAEPHSGCGKDGERPGNQHTGGAWQGWSLWAVACQPRLTESCPVLGNGEDRHMATIPWTDNFETACQQAGQDQKLVLLDFFSPT
jgi:hypothetical protein